MTQINAYLHFNGNCREAMAFYQECLGGELTLQTVGESPMARQMTAEAQKSILHGSLTSGGITLMASDMVGPEGINRGNNISLSLVCSSKAEIEAFYSRLSAGGKAVHPLNEAFFGLHGDLMDRYGVHRMLTYEKPKA